MTDDTKGMMVMLPMTAEQISMINTHLAMIRYLAISLGYDPDEAVASALARRKPVAITNLRIEDRQDIVNFGPSTAPNRNRP